MFVVAVAVYVVVVVVGVVVAANGVAVLGTPTIPFICLLNIFVAEISPMDLKSLTTAEINNSRS